MLNWFFRLFDKDLEKVLNKTKIIKINGVRFIIKKINPLEHLKGSKVMIQAYDSFKIANGNQEKEISEKKIQEHMSEVILSGIVSPKIVRSGEGIQIDLLFNDYDLVNKLYSEIMIFTYGKKKTKSLI